MYDHGHVLIGRRAIMIIMIIIMIIIILTISMCLMLAKVLSAYTYPETQKTIYNGAQKYISLKPYYCELYNIHYTV